MSDQLPAFLANRKKPIAIADTIFKSFGISLPPHVSIQGSHFTLVDGAGNRKPVPTVHLDCVIVDVNANKSRMFWGRNPDGTVKKFEPDSQQPPVCFSDNGIGPSSRSGAPQSPTCAACPEAVWGSATSFRGKGVPACSEGIKMALLVPEHAGELCFMLRVPPASIGAAKAYAKMVKDQGDLDVPDIITRITFTDGEVGTLKFEPLAYITEEIAAVEDRLWNHKATDTLVGRDDVVAGSIDRAPQQIAAPTPPQPTPATYPSFQPAPMQAQPQAEPAKPKGRPRKAAAEPAPPADTAIPAFLQRNPATPTPGFALAKPAGNSNFGIQESKAPGLDLKRSLDQAFGKM